MFLPRMITKDLYYVGVNDRKTRFFENYIPINDGVSYNSYLLMADKTCLFDTVEICFLKEFLANVQAVLNGRELDYLVIHHMEPDHCASIEEIVLRYPNVKIVANLQVFRMIEQFFGEDYKDRAHVIRENDILDLGNHHLKFISAIMVHWPEVMMSYDLDTKVLFSADAFGCFGALPGNIFKDEVDDPSFFSEARRYYSNIVGKYGVNVVNVYKKISTLDIKYICPLHSYIWRQDFDQIMSKYVKWATYQAEEKAVVIAYASMYGNTKQAAEVLASMLAEKGIKNIKVYDLSLTDETYIISEIFRASTLILASPTYNLGMYPKVESLLNAMVKLNVKNRVVGLIENGTWSPKSNSMVKEKLASLENITYLEPQISIKSSITEQNIEDLAHMATLVSELL